MSDKEQMMSDTLYHEAAHAVFDYHAGFAIRRVYVTEGCDGECVSSLPLYPSPSQAFELATGLLAAEYAAYRRSGREVRPEPFKDFITEAEFVLESREVGDPEGDGDGGRALEMLRIVSKSGSYGGLEDCYRVACGTAIVNLDLWWPEIVAVAERLREVGELSGDEVVAVVEAAS